MSPSLEHQIHLKERIKRKQKNMITGLVSGFLRPIKQISLINLTLVRNRHRRHKYLNRLPYQQSQRYKFFAKGTPQPDAHVKHKDPDRPRLELSSSGSVYDTKIPRRTEVRDPNITRDELFYVKKTEAIKWTDHWMLRDVYKRLTVAEYYPLRQNLTCIKNNHMLPEELRTQAHYDMVVKLPIGSSISHVNNRCSISSRLRGKVRKFRISRFFFRHFADYNLLSGVMKSKCGP